ncbi:MAG: hypothetical protein ACI4SG_03975 [Oligosphaeraceae bacterium]
MQRHLSLLVLCLLTLPLGLAAQEWNLRERQDPWNSGKRQTITHTPDGLVLETLAPDSQLLAANLTLSPENRTCLRVAYTATGPSQHGGFLFFGTDQEPDLAEDKKFYLQPLVCDGKPHVMLVDLATSGRDNSFDKWRKARHITKLRLDLASEPGTRILLQEVKLTTADQNELLAALFPEELQKGVPLTVPVDIRAERDPWSVRRIFQAPMVTTQAKGEATGTFYLVKRFTLDKPVKSALWQSSCDDILREVYLNGTLVQHEWGTNWREPDVVEIPGSAFVAGENLLAVAYTNGSLQGGILADLQLLLEDDDFQVLTLEDATFWETPPQDWNRAGFTGKGSPVFLLPPPPNTPWRDFQPAYHCIRAGKYATQVQVLKVEGLDILVRFQSQTPFTPEDRFYGRLSDPLERSLRYDHGTARELEATPTGENQVDILFRGCDGGEFYGDSQTYRWEFGMFTRKVEGETSREFRTEARSVPGAPLATRVEQGLQGPTPLLNDAPFYFTMLTDIAHDRKTDVYFPEGTDTGMEGPDSPFNVIAVRLGGSQNLWWVGPDQYDFHAVDLALSRTLALYPDSKLAPFVWCHPGRWYDQVYPERVSRMEDESRRLRYYVSTVSFDDPEVRKDAQNALDALVKHVEERFGSKVVLYLLMGGISCEWQGWGAHSDNYADFSEGSLLRFQRHAAARGLQVDSIPRRPEREASLDGIFRSPQKSPVPFLYDRYYSQSIAECIDLLAETTKLACSTPKLVGCYYGYHMEYGNLGHCVNGGGHNDLQRLLDSPWVDLFLSPQSYGTRSLGAPNAEMKPYGAIALAGKLSMLEDDTRTSLIAKTPLEQTLNLGLTLAVLKRNIGMSLCHGVPLSHLALIEGRELDHPEIRKLIRQSRKAGQYLLEQGRGTSTRVAAVIDEEALSCFAATRAKVSVKEQDRFMYSHEGVLRQTSRSVQPISGDLLYYQRIALAQFGAPVDVVLLPDLLENPGRYDMVIFLDAVLDKPQLREAVERLKEEGTTLVFPYGVGFLGGDGISADTMSQYLGMTVQQAGKGSLQLELMDGALAGNDYTVNTRFQVVDEEARPMGFYKDGKQVAVAEKNKVYFYGAPALSRDFLRDVARQAGIHLYLESGDNLYASRDVITIHANQRGEKTILLPEATDVVDACTGEILARNATQVSFPMEVFDSRILLLGDAREILQALAP